MNSYPFSKEAVTHSIFREKSGDFNPNSSVGPKVSRQRAKYDDALPGRYYENDNRLSWEFEENPPTGDSSNDDDEYDADGKQEEIWATDHDVVRNLIKDGVSSQKDFRSKP